MDSLGFFINNIMSSTNRDGLSSSLPIWMPFISLCCLIAMARTSRTMLNSSGESWHPCLVPNLRGKAFSFSLLNNDVGCGFVIYGLYYVEVLALYSHFVESFYYEWMLNFVKCFSSIFGYDHVLFVFVFLFVDVVDDVDGFLNVVPSLHPWDESLLIMMDDL